MHSTPFSSSMDPEHVASATTIASSNDSIDRKRRRIVVDDDKKKLWMIFAVIYLIQLIAGPLCFYHVRHQISGKKTNSVLDAFYFSIVLWTSSGYGEFTPATTLAILLVSLFAILGKIYIWILMSEGLEMHITALSRVPIAETISIPVYLQMSFQTAVFYYVLYMVAGTVVLFFLENLDFVHAFYCIITAITGVGSNKCFSTKGGRIFAIFWMQSGTYCLALGFLSFVKLRAEQRQALEKCVPERRMTTAADLDGDELLWISKHTLYKICEMGKLDLKDVLLFIEDFRERDVNKKDGLTPDEINNPRSKLLKWWMDTLSCYDFKA